MFISPQTKEIFSRRPPLVDIRTKMGESMKMGYNFWKDHMSDG